MKIVVLDGYAANPGDLSWANVPFTTVPPLPKCLNVLPEQTSC